MKSTQSICPITTRELKLKKGTVIEGIKISYVLGLPELKERLSHIPFKRILADNIVAQARGVEIKTGKVYKLEEDGDGYVFIDYMGVRELTAAEKWLKQQGK